MYERRNAEGDAPRLWWLDSATGDTVPVFNDDTIQGYYPRLAPNDEFLSFVYIPPPTDFGAEIALPPGHSLNDGHNHTLGASQQIAVYNFETGSRLLIPNLMNSQVRWRPDVAEPEILFVDMQFFGERFGMHLLHADVNDNLVTDISDARLVEDASPNWSPDGSQIAFTRKEANTAMGRQLWLMDGEGENGRALSADANLHHGEPNWSPSAEMLLFQRFDTTTQNAVPGVWVYDLVVDEAREIVGHGFRPKWLP